MHWTTVDGLISETSLRNQSGQTGFRNQSDHTGFRNQSGQIWPTGFPNGFVKPVAHDWFPRNQSGRLGNVVEKPQLVRESSGDIGVVYINPGDGSEIMASFQACNAIALSNIKENNNNNDEKYGDEEEWFIVTILLHGTAI
nr:hypothetical protein Iba_chr14dCG4880 [Ipomoea batatas]